MVSIFTPGECVLCAPATVAIEQADRNKARFFIPATIYGHVCTLVLAWQALADAPIAVAATRDEATARPSEPPGLYRTDPKAIAPRDSRAGGTWIGYSEKGLFVGLTNRWVDRTGERSRGQLVADCLGCESTGVAVDTVKRAVKTDTYAGFNLVVADADRAALLEWDGDLSVTDFEPGVHVVVNVGADSAFIEPAGRQAQGRQQAANATAVRSALSVAATPPTAAAWREQAAAVLGDHEYGVCIHGDGFGTRSASLLELRGDDSEGVGDYWFADGPPCRTAFERVESSL